MKSVSLLLFGAVVFPSMMPNTAEARVIRFAVEQTVKERFLLDEDAQRLIRIAEDSSILR